MDGITFRGISVPEGELNWSFDTSGGPGGQHANRNATRVTLVFDLVGSPSVPDEVKDRLAGVLGDRVRDGEISVVVEESRSQWRNRAIARERLGDLLDDALRPRRQRRRTKPSRSARRKRLREKRHRGEIKRMRQSPNPED